MSDARSDATVTLRARTDADVDELYLLEADLDTWEQRTPQSPTTLSRAAFEARLARNDDRDDATLFVVDVDGEFAGKCSLMGIDGLARHADVGIALTAAFRGRGVGTSALRQLIAFGFDRCNLHRLQLDVIASNVSAIHVYGKLGFVVEGTRREHAWVRGRWEDELVMGLLRSDWRAAARESST